MVAVRTQGLPQLIQSEQFHRYLYVQKHDLFILRNQAFLLPQQHIMQVGQRCTVIALGPELCLQRTCDCLESKVQEGRGR